MNAGLVQVTDIDNFPIYVRIPGSFDNSNIRLIAGWWKRNTYDHARSYA